MNAATTTPAAHRLIKSGSLCGLRPETHHIKAVVFRVLEDGRVRLTTWATWTDYAPPPETMSRDAARAAWKELRADGWEHDKDWTPLAA